MTTQLWFDSRFEGHVAGPAHPESPERVRAIASLLSRVPIAGIELRVPTEATREMLIRVHDEHYVDQLNALEGRFAQLDPDTAVSARSTVVARLAAGAAIEATGEVWSGRTTNAFAVVRPPGHHAERENAMGFCLLNNVALAAEAARLQGAERVLVLDWDVHHGNGTQHSFESRRDVLFLSSHQYPFYPGTGAPEEIGTGEGRGFTVNVALPGGQTDADYGSVFHDVFLPVAHAYRPDIVLVSAGFDPHRADPIGGMRATERGFAAMTSAVKRLAEEVCGGRLVLILEGGYNLDALAQSTHACLEILSGRRVEAFPNGTSPAAGSAIAATVAAVKPYWRTVW
jgi:acetoin utilization deacetylase AcuC-like enzyme